MTRTVVILVFDNVQMFDVVAPQEVFDVANRLAGGDAYRVLTVSASGAGCAGSSGLRVEVDAAAAELPESFDTFVVPGGYDWRGTLTQPGVPELLAEGVRRSRRTAAICTGTFLLGPSGTLAGRRATTHWMYLDELAELHPTTTVERGPIFVEDGAVLTSAGVSAGIDLALAMVEADLGAELAREVARFLVVFMQRPGGQTQFSVRLRSETGGQAPLRALLDAVVQDPAGDHRLAALSERAGFSERHLTRLFAAELGTTPGRWVEEVRVEAARMLLESTDAPLEAVARRSGLGSAETLRRHFSRVVGVPPNAYRQRFRTTGVVTPRVS